MADDTVTISWEKGSPDDVTYIIESKDATDWHDVQSDITDTQSTLPMNPEREASLRVRAKNKWGTSDPTMPLAVPKRAGPPLMKEKPTYEVVDPKTVKLDWAPAENVKGYIEVSIEYSVEMR